MNPQIPLWPFIVVIFLLAAALAWFVWKYWELKQNTTNDKSPRSNSSEHELRAQLRKNEEVFNKLSPVVEHFLILRNGMSGLVKKATATERVNCLHLLMEQAKVWDKNLSDEEGKALLNSLFVEVEQATNIIQLLQKKIESLYSKLRIYDLDEDTECEIRSDYLQLSMMMMDTLESVFNPNFRKKCQGINVQLLNDEITIEDANAMANLVTYLDIETPKWAQRLHKSLEKWAGTHEQPLIDRTRQYLLNGYRFEFTN